MRFFGAYHPPVLMSGRSRNEVWNDRVRYEKLLRYDDGGETKYGEKGARERKTESEIPTPNH